MPRVVWDEIGSRRFETGVDRGMLYLPSVSGVAWNGLVSVAETSTGGTLREIFIDGQKIINNPGLEEYSATIEAMSAPKEFAACAGRTELLPGLYAANQPRQAFGFSYRTMIGNDLLGTDAGYKIHIVYNALAKTPNFTHQSETDKPNVKPRSWDITAVPESYGTYKPTAHFIVDSTKTDPNIVTAIEDILYGTNSADPRLLTVTELMGMLSEHSWATGDIVQKKPILLGYVDIGAGEGSEAIGGITSKKHTISGSGTGSSVAAGGVKSEKPQLAGQGLAGKLVKFVNAYAATGLSQRSVAVAAATQAGDTLLVNCSTNSATSYATAVTDSNGNVYTLDKSAYAASPSLVTFRSPGATGGPGGTPTVALDTSDTLTVTLTLTTGALVVIGAALPASLADGYDVIPASISTGNSTTPSASATPVTDRDIAVLLECHAAAGGNPTVTPPFTSLGYLQGATYQYGSITYHLCGHDTDGVQQTGSETIVATGWKAILYLFKRKSVNAASGGITSKKHTISGTITATSVASGGITQKHMSISGSGSVGAPFKFANGYGPAGSSSRDIPVTTATPAGATLLVMCTTNQLNTHATTLTDTKGNVYTLDREIYTTPTPTETIFRSRGTNGGPGGTETVALALSDHLTVGLVGTYGELAVIGVALPANLAGDYDVIPATISAGNSTTPSASVTPTQDGDIGIGLFASSLGGGVPTINAPYSSLGVQQAGAYHYASATYRLLGTGTAGNAQTSTETIITNTWKGIQYAFKKYEEQPAGVTRVGMTVPISAFNVTGDCSDPFATGKTQMQADAWVMSMVNRGILIGGNRYPPVTKRFWFPVNGSNFNYDVANNDMDGYHGHGTYVIICLFPAVDGVKGDADAGVWSSAHRGGKFTDAGSPVQARANSDLAAIHQFLTDAAADGWRSDECEIVYYQEPKNTLNIDQWNMMLRTYGAAINGPDAPLAADGQHFKLCINLNGASMSLIPTWCKAAIGYGAAPWGTSPCKDGLPTIDLWALDWYENNSATNPFLAEDSYGDSYESLADQFGQDSLCLNEVGVNPGLSPLPPKHCTMARAVEMMTEVHDWYMRRIAAGKRPRHINWWTANCYADGTGQVSSPIGLTPMFGSDPDSDLRIGEFQRWYDDFGGAP